jgi:CHAT domain-containing protein
VTTLLRGEAIESSFTRLAAGRQVLHLSTHGFFLGEDCPIYEFAQLRGGGEPGEDTTVLESPLLRSGLAFAGANHRRSARPGQDDGILTAEEVAALDLVGVEWAVLSACESGLGEVQTGEGVFGLRRAFAAAGVRTLIMSLWPVDDDVTRDWMSRLYRHRFVDGLSTIEAVNRANLGLLAARREAGASTHPFYWAGFVAAGDWR